VSTTPDAAQASGVDPAQKAAASEAGLRYVRDTGPGLRRRKAGQKFAYLDVDGKRIADAATIERINRLAIPPAYTDVWICPDPRGHIQATGRDARGRKQYRYHAKWRTSRDGGKFGHLLDFGRSLPTLRRRLSKDLALPGLPREKVLAIVVSLLAETLIRVGNHEYARSNNSFGLTTLRNRHATITGGRAIFSFRGKSGQDHTVALEDARLSRLIRRCQQLPGQALFQYLDDEGATHPIGSGDVNDYLRTVTGKDITAKEFRTWGGTLAAIVAFVNTPLPRKGGEKAIASAQAEAVKHVADQLGNTPAVCRSSYIHPAVVAAWRDGTLGRRIPKRELAHPRKLETLALAFLKTAKV
jgi:DNA topoisomerase I